jgi:hypothetical protein
LLSLSLFFSFVKKGRKTKREKLKEEEEEEEAVFAYILGVEKLDKSKQFLLIFGELRN